VSAEITWRPYDPSDEKAVLRVKREQDEVLGARMDFNNLAEHPVLIAEVAEVDGEIIGAHCLESAPEYCMISRDPRFTAAAERRAPVVCNTLKQHGFRMVRCLVPAWMGADTQTIEDALRRAGFRSDDHEGYKHLLLDLR
jgi:hypothetical protein